MDADHKMAGIREVLQKNLARTVMLAALPYMTAGSLGAAEPHLDIVARTTAEAERIARVTALPGDFSAPQPFEALSGGAATVRAGPGRDVFSQPSANLSRMEGLDFEVGDGIFRKFWVSSPASTLASDGLGPLYNARSCESCHIHDGRGHAPKGHDDSTVSMLLRVGVPDPAAGMAEIEGYLGTGPDPHYGAQLQDLTVAGLKAEYRLRIHHEPLEVELADGLRVTLQKPRYELADLGYGALHPQAMISPRIAPPMTGLGLLEAIPAADILALADPEDADGDGISGRANVVWSVEYDQPMLGRFGLKAGRATVRAQSAAAFSTDIGISTPLFPAPHGDCTPAQSACRTAPHGDGDIRGQEVDLLALDITSFYSRNLGVPARRHEGAPQVLRGKQLFHDAGCADCHRPAFVTHRLQGDPAQSFQLIWPYSDMLLHDMGPGLADGFTEARATGREWRTPPLWGIGLAQHVSPEAGFLHDGRARTLLEAVLWHGGEARAARDAVAGLQTADRDALIAFLESL